MKIFDLLKIGAEHFPENIAISHGDRRINYRDLYHRVIQLADFLEKSDLPPGSRIAILFENSIEYVISYFAVFKAVMVAVPLDTSLKPERINMIIKDSGAEAIFLKAKYRRYFDKMIDDESNVKMVISDSDLKVENKNISFSVLEDIFEQTISGGDVLVESESGTPVDIERLFAKSGEEPNDLAAIFYTSGSTGEPKGVMLSHRNLVSNTIATCKYLELTAEDNIMVILPFYYIYGNSLLLTHILVGGRVVIDNRFLYPEVILDTMERESVTGFSGVPSNFIILLENSSMPKRELKSVRYFTQAGGAMAPEVTKKFIDTFPEKELFIMYGQTEAAPRITWCPPGKLAEKMGSIGIPVPGITVKIIDDKGKEAPIDVSGELIASGPNVMLGYWNQKEATDEVIKDGWLYTGDLALKDDDGYFFITGRKKEIIKSGGNRVSAKEVEECLLEHDNIIEAAVVGIPDNLLGEAIKAVIVTRNGVSLSRKDIESHCRPRISEHKIPHKIQFLDSLPKYQSGKINKPLLKEMA